ncbi:RluA family pseudouridine synthase [Ponticaulis sp.]|uniref:RluA family pseudouridine synthase n=1 Tax=Ponticaulis sp. TaxID=2020902 RepID=UPI000B727BF9|nr:RluA family pseudouridine synthase [Ponticaulis sp.]MAI89096.1 pseudouridine synthase [Ponticaulis sp.]OUY01379.1 MAG: pseudouridine synthase [Hyphomonadaceae bacterium TMED5]
MSADVQLIEISYEESGARLDKWFKRRFDGITQGQVEKFLRTGQIRVDGARAKSNTRLEEGQMVRVPPLPTKADIQKIKEKRAKEVSQKDAAFIRELIIYEDNDIVALNKPSGLAVQGGTNTNRHVDGMLDALGDGEHRPRLVHRLDRDTSGVLLIAKHPRAAKDLGDMFRERTLKKVYWAVVGGVPMPHRGQIRSWMMKGFGPADEKERMVPAVQSDRGSQHAVTEYAVISTAAQRAAWVALSPLTGRTHQLRFHMEEMKNAIVGDPKYTGRREPMNGLASGLHLHARALVIPRDHGPDLELIAPLPKHMTETFKTLGFLLEEAGKDPWEPFE